MKWYFIILTALIILPVATATADWKEVKIKYNWDRSSYYYCDDDSQCLVHAKGTTGHKDVYKYFETTDKTQWPRCIDEGQYILDYYCEKGNWTTRTKLVADQLIQLGESLSPDKYSVYCTHYTNALNNYRYLIENQLAENYLKDTCVIAGAPYNCVNNICVLNTGSTVAFGTSINPFLEEQQKKFFTAINKSKNVCSDTSGNQFSKCSAEDVWYNPKLKLVIFAPKGSPGNIDRQKMPAQKQMINNYVMSVLHIPDNPGRNFRYYSKTNLFNNIFFAKGKNTLVFGFLEENIKEDDSGNPAPMDFIGVRYSNADLGEKPCLNIIKQYDDKAFCEEQTGTSFNVVARHRQGAGESPIVKAWKDLTGKLRIK